MRRPFHGLIVSLFWLILFVSPAQADEQHLVLVASAQSGISRLSAEDARKLYLGTPYLSGGLEIRPLRNNTHLFLQEVFMQKVMFMSTPAYERQILSRVFRTGGGRPPVYTDMRELAEALRADRTAITYMSRETAAATPGIKVIGELW